MIENASVSEHAWLFVASSDNWQGIVKHGSFGIRYGGILEEAQSGEPCVAYVPRQGQRLFIGLGELTGSYYHDEMQKYPHRVKLDVKLAKNGVPLKSLRSRLQFVNDVPNLGLALRKGALRIPLSDYEVIKARLKPQPEPGIRGESEKLTENEVRELISIPIEPIDTHTNDTHTKAEGALLELGNCLEEYETYVTPDDKNKKFRDKSLAEIATLRELPEDFIPPGVKDTVRHIDVIWFKKKVPAYCFEVEHSTNITQALARFSDLRGLTTEFMIVAPAGARGKFKGEVQRTLFESIKDRVQFRSYGELAKFLTVAREFAREKRSFFGQ